MLELAEIFWIKNNVEYILTFRNSYQFSLKNINLSGYLQHFWQEFTLIWNHKLHKHI